MIHPLIDILKQMRARYASACVLILPVLLLFLSACERPFVAPRVPEIEIVEPRLERIFFESPVVLKASASSFRPIDRIELNGSPMAFDEEEQLWLDTLFLESGVNKIQLSAFDVEEVEATMDLSMAFMRPRYIDDAPGLPDPWRIGGHTATLLQDGSVLVTGGAQELNQAALKQAFLLTRFADAFVLLENGMDQGRIGHTASLLPDGRVLILGGSSSELLFNANQLASTALLYDPVSMAFTPVPFNRDPVRRANHVTFVSTTNNQIFIDVYGGEGAQSISSDAIITRGDIDTYALARDTLFFIENSEGVAPAHGLTATLLTPGRELSEARYMVSGSRFFVGGWEDVNFTIDFNESPIRVDRVGPHLKPRFEHASAFLDDGLIVIIGGFQGRTISALNSSEVYFDVSGSFFTLDTRVATRSRFSHTATKLQTDRILVIGGFDISGQATGDAQYFVW